MSRAPLSVQCRDESFYMSSVDARRPVAHRVAPSPEILRNRNG